MLQAAALDLGGANTSSDVAEAPGNRAARLQQRRAQIHLHDASCRMHRAGAPGGSRVPSPAARVGVVPAAVPALLLPAGNPMDITGRTSETGQCLFHTQRPPTYSTDIPFCGLI